jgi:iron(III) transport system ATP-binding protein
MTAEQTFDAAPRSSGDDALISCRGVTKRFEESVALTGFDLDVHGGQIVSLLGPSGCGKTTALRVIAGFEYPDDGTVEIGGRPVAGDPADWVRPEQRRVGMVFQDYALFPHMTAAKNIAYGLSGDAADPSRVAEVLELVGLAGHAERMPHELSGGEQQRVALARALAPRPAVVLLDEPFSSLDAPQRDRMRREVRRILTDANATAVFVTHDQEEALAMSDVVAIMRAGRVIQTGAPDEVYRHPVDEWVARFLGEVEVVPGVASGSSVKTALGSFPLAEPLAGNVDVLIRPESVRLEPADDGGAEVIDAEFYGHDQLVMVELTGGRRLLSRLGPTPVLRAGDRVSVAIGDIVAFARED